MEKVTIATPIKVVKSEEYLLVIKDAQGEYHYFHKKHTKKIKGKNVTFKEGQYDGKSIDMQLGKVKRRVKQYFFDEVLAILISEKPGKKFRGSSWNKIYSYIEIRYIKSKGSNMTQPYIALILNNGGEMVHPYIPSSYDMIGEMFIEVI